VSGSRPLLRWLWSGTRLLWERAKREHSTPREVGWSVGVGVFSGCTPFIGFHLGIAFVLATLFRLNRLWSMVGSRVSTNVLYVAIVLAEIQGSHRARTGAWAPLTMQTVWDHRREYAKDWLLGAAVMGVMLGAVLGLLAYRAALRWHASHPEATGAAPAGSGAEERSDEGGAKPGSVT
jgi:uncharacterized protein (DUF2062 family)